jgi:hypothetical protein
MGSLTPKPTIQHKNKKLISKEEKEKEVTAEKDKVFTSRNKYKKLKIKNNAPNWVQKNIKYAASTHRRVFANLYKIKNEGISNIS